MSIEFKPIGTVHTPFVDDTPFGSYENAEGDFYIELNPELADGLYLLDKFKYIYVIFHIDRPKKKPSLRVHPPKGDGREVGLFATRSPHRFNSIGLTITRVKKIVDNGIILLASVDACPLCWLTDKLILDIAK